MGFLQLPQNLGVVQRVAAWHFDDALREMTAKVMLVPQDFEVPVLLETDRVRLRPLLIGDVKKDFEAVVSSEEHLRKTFRPGSKWPKGLSLDKNLADLQWHQDEFAQRTSFTYTVVALDESEVLGCLYIYPCKVPEYDAQVWLWIRQSRLDDGLDDHLFATVENWIEVNWPFERTVYPGRSISHEDWRLLNSGSAGE